MSEDTHFEVQPDTVKLIGTVMHGIAGTYQGRPVTFICDVPQQSILVPEGMEAVYHEILNAVLRYLRIVGKI
jgi:hypothetical protein